MGTSSFAVPCLEKLITEGHEIIGVICQPDRPQGRNKKIIPPPVKEMAILHGIPVFQPEKIKNPEAIELVRQWNPELIVVVSYGQILPPDIINLPRFGCINVHASLLPFYRGAAPIQRAIMAGEKETGVTTMYMDEGLDTGDIIKQLKVPLELDITYGELESVLADMGANLIIETLKDIENGILKRQKQDHTRATYAAMITPADELIKWDKSAFQIHNQIRALSPKPGAYSFIEGTKLKIFKTRIVEENSQGKPGMINDITKCGFIIQTGSGTLEVLEVQKEGKKRLPASEFVRGSRINNGLVLGEQGKNED